MQRFFVLCLCISITFLANISLSAPRLSSPGQRAVLSGVDKADVVPDFSPGAVCFFGEKSFPLLLGKTGSNIYIPMAAASYYEKGRIVLFGHSGMVGKEFVEANAKLCTQIIRWLAESDSPHIAVIGEQGTADFLKSQKINADFSRDLTDKILAQNYDVILCDPGRVRENQIEKFQQYIADGGGWFSAATGWGWEYGNVGKNIKTEFIGNKIAAPMGIVWTNQFADQSNGGFESAANASVLLHPKNALDLLLKDTEEKKLPKEDWPQLIRTLELAVGSIPAEQAGMFSALQDSVNRKAVPTQAEPIAAAEHPFDRIAMILQTHRFMYSQNRGGLPDGLEIPAFDAAADFPGSVPEDARRFRQKVSIDTKICDWHSTGMYAAPGEVITVTIPETAAKSGRFSVRVGVHSDKLWHLDRWQRYPEISLVVQINKTKTKLVNPFGGNIYIVVPDNAPKELGTLSVEIDGAVESPYYVLGKTSNKQWKQSRQAPGPWAELASDRLIITVPSRLIRELNDPKEMMEFWNAVLDADNELIGRPVQRNRPERITADRQISAGWMHSGYPVMSPTQTERGLADLSYLHERGDRWGFFHEFGHNHQNQDWVFEGTGEVTVNLFTLYNFVHQCDTPIDVLRRETHPEARKAAKAKYIKEGAKFEQWKRDPFLALGMYIELIEAFGWDSLKSVIASYNDPSRGTRPRNDDEKRDQWMCRYSKVIGKNLGPYFDQWGVPVSQSAKNSIKDLPVWLPEE